MKDTALKEKNLLAEFLAIMVSCSPRNLPSVEMAYFIENKNELRQFLEKSFENRRKILADLSNNKILTLISPEPLVIEALSDSGILYEATHVFGGYRDPKLLNFGLNQPGPATPKTRLQVYEQNTNATFQEIFNFFAVNLEKVYLTQSQIIRFCQKYPRWLRQGGYATFFLTKANGEYFVVNVNVRSDGLRVFVDRLGLDSVWSAEYRRRVVSPQLISLAA